jgi:dinuclear metal center YbgI/SA1388 family protein
MASPSFTDTVINAVKKLFPEELADSAWDNTGLLLGEAPLPAGYSALRQRSPATVFLTNDLTGPVVEEALNEDARIIICYHPVIFRPLKSLTPDDPMQSLLLQLAAERISVYCPHTAMDAASGGLNDWLCDILLAGEAQVKRTVPQVIARALPEGHQGAGYGREMVFQNAQSLSTLLRRLTSGLGQQRHVMLALPPSWKTGMWPDISKVAVCAGSGADVLKNTNADLIVTGEMSHHYALRFTQLGQAVATVFHSNSERQYLSQRLKPMLEVQLETTPFADARVVVSSTDCDPFEIFEVSELP